MKLLTKVYLLEAERRRRSVFSSQFQEAPVAGY